MEQIKELEEVLELLNTKQYTKLRQYLAELNDADIAGLLEELEEEDMLKVFRGTERYQSSAAISGRFRRKYHDGRICRPEGESDGESGHRADP